MLACPDVDGMISTDNGEYCVSLVLDCEVVDNMFTEEDRIVIETLVLDCIVDIALDGGDGKNVAAFVLNRNGVGVVLAKEGSKEPLTFSSVDCDTVGVILAIHCSKDEVSFALDCTGHDSELVTLVCKD